MSTTKHSWKFFRAGGFDQVRLDTGADLMNLDQLDQKLWVALACPTVGLEFDARTLGLIDTDKDGRIRASELIAAIKWAGGLLKNPDDLVRLAGKGALPLAAINEAVPEGATLASSAKQILVNLGRAGAAEISLADTADTAKIFAATAFNGDGVIVEDSAADEATKALIKDILACAGSLPDRSGKPGIDQAKVDAFFTELAAFDGWVKKSEAEAATILPLGEGTAAASAAVRAVKAKVDDYFGRCRLAAFDTRALAALNREEKEYLAVAARDLSITAAEVAGFPLARVAPGQALPLLSGVNPAWAGALATLHAAAVKPLLGDKLELSEADWSTLTGKLGAFECWQAGKAGGTVEKLGLARVRELLAGGKDALAALIAQDKAEQGNADSIAGVERLVRYVSGLHTLCANFVNFRDLYDGGAPATFQCGVLYLDQRSCNLCIPVADAGKHATMAGLAGAYLAYLDCTRKGTGEKLSIVAIFSQGDDDNLMVGRNGVFYDRKGKDYDATITKIVANPISLRQAFWLPYKKFVRMIEEQVSKRAAAADADANAKLAAAATATANADKTAKPAEPKKVDVGTVAALGVAFGAIGGFFTAIATGLTSVLGSYGPLAILAVLAGVITLISGPSMILAYIKLRKRNLGPILDANGWAVNAAAKINVPFGTSLTGIATLPPGAQRDLADPFAEKQSPWPRLIVFAIIFYLAYLFCDRGGYIHQWTKGRFGTEKKVVAAESATLGGAATNAPAAN